MKRVLLALALCLAATAYANGKPDPVPVTGAQDQHQTQQAQAAAAAKAQAAAQSQSNATGTGIGVGMGGAATAAGGESQANSDAYSGGSGVTTDSRMLVFPAPVWSTVPEARTCIATQSQAWAAGWNLVSRSTSNQASDPACIGVLMARSAYNNCHFLSEALITARVYATVFPGHSLPEPDKSVRNLSLAECEELKRPRLVPTPMLAAPPTAVVTPTPVAVAPAPVACPAPAPRKPRAAVVKPKAPALTCPVPLVPRKQ